MINRIERRNRSITADVPIRYDANSPSLIRYYSQGVKGLICTASARDVSELVNQDKGGALFDSNIRRFLGKGRAVNADILRTATDASSSYLFWFLNNGITVICDSFDAVTDPDHPVVKIRNLQIVNGCQTATALAHAAQDGSLRADTRVLLKIYETTDASLASRFVLTTNNQNRISTRDLKANDAVQQDMQRAFERYGLLYEHKINQYATVALGSGQRIVSNDYVRQAYLAIALKRPGDARGRKYKIWADYYGEIFSGAVVEPHVVCVYVYDAASAWSRIAQREDETTELRAALLKKELFHVSRIAAFLWRGSDAFNQQAATLQGQIVALQRNAELLYPFFESAIAQLEALISANPDFANDLEASLKSALLESAITRSLHSPASVLA